MNKVRNGEIDILRFVFAMTIVIYHFSTNYSTITWYRGGGVGVEFFFMLTGILMAKSAQNVVVTKEQIPRQLYSFLKRKIASFYPHYLSAIILQMVLFRWVLQHETIHLIINRIFCGIPDLLLVQVSGLMYDGGVEVGGAWFLSALVIALFILYPIQLYYNEQATLYIFPIIGVMGLVVGMNSGLFDFGTYYIYYFTQTSHINFSYAP